jgi:hypothetical protein
MFKCEKTEIHFNYFLLKTSLNLSAKFISKEVVNTYKINKKDSFHPNYVKITIKENRYRKLVEPYMLQVNTRLKYILVVS